MKAKNTNTKKHNREALKLDFFTSPFSDLAERWRHQGGTTEAPNNGNFKKQTKGRAEEKKKRKEEMINQARIEAQQEGVEIYKPSMELLSQLHADILLLVREKLTRMKQSKATPQANELAKLREMIKIEKGEPTKYVQQETTATITQTESITPEEQSKIASLLSADQ